MKTLFILLLTVLTINVYSQTISHSSYATCGKTSNVELTYTVGQPLISPCYNINCLTPGFQQGILKGVSVNEVEHLDFSLDVYPNPVINNLFIKSNKNVYVNLYDISGKEIYKNIVYDKLNINMTGYNSGVYLLVLYDLNNKMVKQYKILKNN
jgi:hypothetical protein